jgi:shikimate 5-dehydrogenase
MSQSVDTLSPAEKPTFYFIGVTTGQSAIMRLFPKWAEFLGLDGVIRGIDMKIHDRPESYVQVAEFIKNDPLSLGALVTTHKMDMYQACQPLGVFDYFDPLARGLKEISCISKLEGAFRGHAKDPITSGNALAAFLPPGYFAKGDKEVFIMGAGGSSVATCYHLMQTGAATGALPARIIVSNRSQGRLEELEAMLEPIRSLTLETVCVGQDPAKNDAIMAGLNPGALVINATGMGKDTPGSPLTDAAPWPQGGLIWEFNYRGKLDFMHQALAKKAERNLTVEDGWIYFIHGWSTVIAEVFHIDIAPSGARFDELCRIAESIRT